MKLSELETTHRMLPVLPIILIEEVMKHEVDNEKLKEENPIKYYLQHTGDKKVMKKLRWDNPKLYRAVQRAVYLKQLQSKEPLHRCPKCGDTITCDEWGEEYCPRCGVITRNNYPYTAGVKHDLPYGLKLS